MPRESWTDDKLDALNEKIDLRFDHVDERLSRVETQTEALRTEMREGFAAINARFDAKFDAANARFDALQRSLLYVLISSVTISLTVTALVAVFFR